MASLASLTRGIARDWLLPDRTMPWRLWPPLAGMAYVAVIQLLGGLRIDHIELGMLGFLDLYNRRTRLFLWTFLPFIATGAVFDSMRYYYASAIDGRVHVADVYNFDRTWFGVGGRTLNELFQVHHWAIADLAAGFAYLTFVAEFLGMAMLLFFRGYAERAATFARCFFTVNVMGFITYFIFPTAPPWYVSAHGFGPAVATDAPSPAAAIRFDELTGTHVMERMYGHGVDVFGAIPSLHCAYPALALMLALRFAELRTLRIPAALFLPLMLFAAVYLQHHYVIDAIVGLVYAAVALAIVAAWERARKRRAAR